MADSRHHRLDFGPHRFLFLDPAEYGGALAFITEVDAAEANQVDPGEVLVKLRTDGALGSAFCIATTTDNKFAFYLTARHNVSEWIDAEGTPLVLGVPAKDASSDQPMALFSIPTFAIEDHHTDIAGLVVDWTKPLGVAPCEVPSPFRTWDFGRPVDGANVYALGFGKHPQHGITFTAACGVLQEWWPAGRDFARSMETRARGYEPTELMDYPALQTDAWYLGGMSGGPVVYEDGRLVGVVSRGGYPPNEQYEEPAVSFAALISRLRDLRFAAWYEEDTRKNWSISIDELIQEGAIDLAGSQRPVVYRHTDGTVFLGWDGETPPSS